LLSKGKNLLKFGGRGGGTAGQTAGKTTGQAQKLAQANKAKLNQINQNITLLKKDNVLLRKQLQDRSLSNRQRNKIQSKIDKNDQKLAQQRAARQSGGNMKPEPKFGMTQGGMGAFFALQMAGQLATSGEGDTIPLPKSSFADEGIDKRQVGDVFNYAAMGASVAGPRGAAFGAAVGSTVGAVRQFGETKKAEKSRDATVKDIDERLKIQRTGDLTKKSKSMVMNLQEIGGAEASALAAEIQRLQDTVRDSNTPIKEVREAAEKLQEAMKEGDENLENFIYVSELGKMIQTLNETIAKKTAEIDGIMIGNIDAAKEAERQIALRQGIQNPNLTGVSKNIVDRGLQGEAAIAAAQTAKQEDAQKRRELMQESAGLDLTKPEGQERKKEIDEELKQSAKNLKDKIDQGAVSLYNNLTAASAELEETIKKLAEQQSEAFDNRLDFASSLKGNTLKPELVMDAVNAFKNAKTPEERLTAAEDLADLKSESDAINPAIFKGILSSQGITPEKQEQLTRGIVEASLEKYIPKGKISEKDRQKMISEIAAEQKKTEPDMDQTKIDKDNLEKEIKETEKRIKEFGVAFDAENLNTAIAKIGESLDAFAKGTLDATQILGAFQSINIKAEQAIIEGNKRITILEQEIAATKSDLSETQATLNTVKQGLGK
jgi:hypothetical protein